MRLPGIAYKKIIFLAIFLFCLLGVSLIQVETVSAQCPNNGCMFFYCKGTNPGTCVAEGGVTECPLLGGWQECVGGQWVETDKRTSNLTDTWQLNPWGNSSLEKFQEALVECGETGEISLECFTGGAETLTTGATSGVIPNSINTVSTMLLGPVGQVSGEQALNQGAIADISNLMTNLYDHPPASSTEYLADLGRNLGIVPKPVYAQQGTGFSGLQPVLGLWKVMRNIAYLFFVIIFVFVGFAIMFRVKIDPQTVISIQNALPKLVIALLLVTFSYAIAGFLIDLMYIFIALLFSLFQGQLESIVKIQSLGDLLGQNVFSATWYILGGDLSGVTSIASNIDHIVRGLIGEVPIIATALGRTAGAITTAVLAIAIAFSMFKLFFSLLISYVSIIVGVIFSPLMLMLEAVPGQKGLGNWIKMMLSNIIVFPLVAAIFILAAILTKSYDPTSEAGWVAPFLGSGWGASSVPALIGMGIILLAPSLVDTVKKAVGAPGLAGLAGGVMAPLGAAGGVVMAPIRSVTEPIIGASQKAKGEELAKKLKLPGHQRI